MIPRLLLATPILLISACASQPQSPAPTGQTSVVFFTANSVALDAAAQKVVSDSAVSAKAAPGAVVHVRGFAAPDTGSPEFNKSLAETRAHAVADGLTTAGVPSGQIRIESRGAVSYDLWPRESRRVEIVVGG